MFLYLALFSAVIPAGAQQRAELPWWYTLEQGISLFRSGSYGDALLAFEDARRGRLAEFTRMEQDLILFLSAPGLRPYGDSLELAEQYIAESRAAGAAGALEALYYRVPKETLGGSVKRALEELNRLKAYPEAEFWLGEIYRMEGELAVALRQYGRAWDSRALLETPCFDAEILYKMADIHRLRGEYQEMERRATEIIEGADPSGVPRDTFWTGAAGNLPGSAAPRGGGNQIRAAMSRILENEGVDRFLTLYRYSNAATERAHRLLGFFFYASNRYQLAAEHLMFAFLIQNTALIDDVMRRQYGFTFTSLENLVALAGRGQETARYLEETAYYRTVYYLASALYATGKNRPGSQLWAFLAGSADAGEWGARARANRNPVIGPAVEMP